MRTRGRLRQALDPLPVHASIAKALRASLPFAVMLLFGLVPTLLFAGRMYDSICLEFAGQKAIGRVVATQDFTKNVPEVQRTGNQPTVRATIEFPAESKIRRFEWTGWILYGREALPTPCGSRFSRVRTFSTIRSFPG